MREPTSGRDACGLHQRADAARRAFSRADALVSLAQGYLRGDRPHQSAIEVTLTTQFDSLETSHKLLANPAAIWRDYFEHMEAFLTRTRGTLTAAGVDYHLALTDQPIEQTLLQVLVARSRLGPGRRAG